MRAMAADGGEAVAPTEAVVAATGHFSTGSAATDQAEASQMPRGADGRPTSAVVGGAAGAALYLGQTSAVPPPPAAQANLVVAPTVHLHSGPMGGGVEAELSAGHLLFVDGEDYVTARNLVMFLVFGFNEVSTRLVRLGCLSGCPGKAAEAAMGGPHARTPEHRATDQHAYKHLVAIARYAELWGFKANLCAIVEQGLHLSKLKQYAMVESAAITAASAWTLHAVSANNCDVNDDRHVRQVGQAHSRVRGGTRQLTAWWSGGLHQ